MAKLAKDGKVIIVGAGVFGLSTSIHLAQRGYTNVTVLDRQPYHKTLYSYFAGCDSASADINKIVRSAYGSQTDYQELTFRAIDEWKRWNDQIASGQCVPPGMNRQDKVFHNTGSFSFNDRPDLPTWELDTLKTMAKHGHGETQFATNDPNRVAEAQRRGHNIDPFRLRDRGRTEVGVLDSSGGTAVADKACRFALHKASSLGVHFILDPIGGYFESFIYKGKEVVGVRTRDCKIHDAALVIMACGGWTPTLVPALDGLAEATGGSVVLIKIPDHEHELLTRFAPETFPTWMYKMRDGAEGGLYGFPRDERGFVKIGYRGTKYTNPVVHVEDGQERSTPVTRYSEGINKLTSIPQKAMNAIRTFVHDFLPELEPFGVALTRVCWYTDSFDNHFVVDHAPGTPGLMVATAGSGHAFKYLPILGDWIVDVIEGKDARTIVKSWRWRELGVQLPYNILMEGSVGERALKNVKLSQHKEVGVGSVDRGAKAKL